MAFGFDVAAWVLSAGTGISAVASAIVTVILDNGSRGAPAFAWAVTLLLGAAHFLVVPALLHAGQQRSQGSRLPWRRRLRAALAYVVPSILIVSFVSFLGCWFLGSVFEHGLGLLAGICLGCVVPGLSGSVATRAWVALREAPSSRGARTEQTRPALAPGLSIRVRACAEDFAPLTRSHSPRALAPAPVGRDRAAPIEPSASPRPLPLARSPAASRLGLASK